MKVLHRSARSGNNYFTSIEQVVGKQLRRSLATGLPIDDQMIGEPIVISRAQLITVESVSGGITVSSPGKALSAGAAGELIQVELPGRVKVFGTIVDSNIVRIAARATPSR
jgi:flagella basal body P-ring formation protein FlgA